MTAPIGRFWHREGGRLRCDLCPHACLLLSGEQGACTVREGSDEGIVLTTYGWTSGACLDPIEKKPLFHFYPGTAALSFGTAGCNLRCSHCSTWLPASAEGAHPRNERAAPEDIARVARAVGARSVAFTYNDPIIFAEYAIDTARACRAAGIKTVAVTSGYMAPAARPELFAAMDAVSIDLKAMNDDFYREHCGGHLQPVLDTISYAVRETSTWVELTTLLAPGLNDSDGEIDRLAEWVGSRLGPDTPLHFNSLPSVPPSARPELLRRAGERARATGLHNVYTHVASGDGTTFCRGCDSLLIERLDGQITHWRLVDGCCRACGRELAGCFDDAPGAWEALRVPVVISPTARELPGTAHERG